MKRSRAGLEIGLIGVDGTGKTSIAAALVLLDPRVVVVYMGYKQFRTWPMKLYERGQLCWPLGRFTSHYEWFWRRMHGGSMARHGHIVVYDRHPAEHCHPKPHRLGDRVGNLLNRGYDFDLDLSFFLSGDPGVIFARKREYSPEKLREMDRDLRLLLAKKRIAFKELDVTSHGFSPVMASVIADINRKCVERGIPKLGEVLAPRVHDLRSEPADAGTAPPAALTGDPSSSEPAQTVIPSECAVGGDESISRATGPHPELSPETPALAIPSSTLIEDRATRCPPAAA